jgi:hypothetical protein
MSELIVYPTASYNSWISLDDADLYFEGRLHADNWTGATDEEKTAGLQTAFRSLQELTVNLDDLDSDDQDDVDALVLALQQAQCEQALHELKFDIESSTIKSVSLGGLLSASFMSGPDATPDRFSSRALAMLAPYRTIRTISRIR